MFLPASYIQTYLYYLWYVINYYWTIFFSWQEFCIIKLNCGRNYFNFLKADNLLDIQVFDLSILDVQNIHLHIFTLYPKNGLTALKKMCYYFVRSENRMLTILHNHNWNANLNYYYNYKTLLQNNDPASASKENCYMCHLPLGRPGFPSIRYVPGSAERILDALNCIWIESDVH